MSYTFSKPNTPKIPMPEVKKPKEIYIIQTNSSIDKWGNAIDFQSMIYGYSESWDEFKTYLLSNDSFTEKLISGTMIGATKPKDSKIIEVLINDDRHLEVIIENYRGLKFKLQYYLVTVEQFRNI